MPISSRRRSKSCWQPLALANPPDTQGLRQKPGDVPLYRPLPVRNFPGLNECPPARVTERPPLGQSAVANSRQDQRDRQVAALVCRVNGERLAQIKPNQPTLVKKHRIARLFAAVQRITASDLIDQPTNKRLDNPPKRQEDAQVRRGIVGRIVGTKELIE